MQYRMTQMRDNPNNTLNEDQIMEEVLGERRGWTRGIGQKLPQSAFTQDSHTSCSQKYTTQEDVHRIMANYTAPLWSNAKITPPSFNEQEDDENDDDDDDEDDE